MAEKSNIRWCEATWNPFRGCTKISPGCDNCYADTLAQRYNWSHLPVGEEFTPTYIAHKVDDPRRWLKSKGPIRIFCNSLSDPFHVEFTDDMRDAMMRVMVEVPEHDYLLLTKRPKDMHRYLCREGGWLDRMGLDEVPPQIWIGTSIENDRYTFRADWLRKIPATVRFLSCEPLLGPLPSLDLTDIGWVIAGGESGQGYRPSELDWSRDLRDRSNAAGVAFYYKQGAAIRTEMKIELDGVRIEEYPFAHPTDRAGQPRTLGRFTGRHAEGIPDLTYDATLFDTPVEVME